MLGLYTPEQAPAPADSFLLDAKATEAWFETLPMANIGETARLVFNALVEFNRIEMSEVARARTAEKFCAPTAYICHNLEKHYHEFGFPLSAKAGKTAALAKELNNEMAIAYKVIVEQMLEGASSKFDRNLVVISLHHALYFLGEVLKQCAYAYEAPPKKLWYEVHGIYTFATQNKVHLQQVKAPGSKTRTDVRTIESLYREILLFGISGVHRMRHAQIRTLSECMRAWCEMPRLTDEVEASNNIGIFSFDLRHDAPPQHLTQKPTKPGKWRIIFDTRALIKYFKKAYEASPEERSKLDSDVANVPRAMLKQLILTWGKPGKRRHGRTKLKFQLQITLGLVNIHQLMHPDKAKEDENLPTLAELNSGSDDLKQPRHRPAALGRAANFAVPEPEMALSLAPLGDDVPLAQPKLDPLPTDNLFSSRAPSLTPRFDEPSKPQPIVADATPGVFKANTINESAGGYCIQWPTKDAQRVKIGEVIGIQSAQNATRFGIAVARWLGHASDHRLEVGVQILSPVCQSGMGQVLDARGTPQPGEANRCVIFSHHKGRERSTRIMIESLNLKSQERLWLKVDQQEGQIELGRELECGSGYGYFEFEWLDQPTGKGDSEVDDSRFDSLWSSL